jgi:hypothetical protein
MNDQLQQFARQSLKDGLAQLPAESHRFFRLMYARDDGRRSVKDAEAMPINDVVDAMPADKLDWAMQQVQSSIDKLTRAAAA